MSNNTKSVRAIAEMPFKVSHQTTWQGLAGKRRFTYRRLKNTICHTADHKVKRILLAMDHIGWNSELSEVIFFDEKKFNLNGPDGVKHYSNDLRQFQKCFFSRDSGGRSVML